MTWIQRLRTPLLLAAAGACGGDAMENATESGRRVVRDSAGVRIVENGTAPVTVWRVGEEPLFTVGWDPEGPQLSWPQSGRILPDGGAVIGDSNAGTILRIGPGGSLLDTWGRKGQGPGEYQGFDAIIAPGDSILVSDVRLRRTTLLGADGEVRATSPKPGAFVHHASAILGDGRVLLTPGEGYSGVDETRQEWVFETQPILAHDHETGVIDTLAELPHLRRWFGSRGAPPGVFQVKGRAGGFAGGFAWARSDERSVRWYDGSGRLLKVARWGEEPVPVTTGMRGRMTRIMEEALSGRDEAFVAARLQELDEGFDRHEGPVPYWDSFFVDRRGNAWLSSYRPEARLESRARWRVVRRDGTFIGWVDLPEVIAVLDITDDRVLAVRRDELDVPAVVLLELTRG